VLGAIALLAALPASDDVDKVGLVIGFGGGGEKVVIADADGNSTDAIDGIGRY